MADPRKPVLGALKAIQTASKAADEQLAAGKLKAALEAQQAPMTRPQGTGLPLMPRDNGMYTLREQKDLPRMVMVDKARAANKSPKYNERTQDLLDSPKARKKVDSLINKGKDLNVQEWYGTEPLRQVAMDAGRTPEQFESLMAQLASASQRNPVDKQNQMGSYLYHLSETGQLPENSLLLTNKLKKALKDDPSLAEGRTLVELPTGYGSLAQGDIFNRALMISQGKIGEALPPNKKLGTFYENLLGNLRPVTVDVNALRGPIIEQGDPRWLASKLVEKDDKGKVINSYKPREMFDTGEMTMREAKQRPGFWEAAPKGSEYAGFEELWQRGAKRHNIEPAEAQALGWYGSADVTALKTKPENYVDNLERLIKRTAEQTGKSPTEVMNDMVTGKGFLRKEGGAVNRKESPQDMARFQKRFAMHKAMGGSVKKMAGGGRASIFDAPKMAGGGRASIFDKPVHMIDGGKVAKGVMGAVNKASAAADAAMAKPTVDRLSMSYKDVTKRVPEVADAVDRLLKGEITKAQYNDIVKTYKPVTPYSFVPKPATKEEAVGALRGDAAKERYGKQAEYEPGSKIGLRLDIPAYTGKGVWVNSIHDEKGKKVAYGPVASVKNADLGISQNESKRIALGGAKAPYARIKGDWNPISEEEAIAKAQEYLNHPEWRQIGMDPERHSYFYDRRTMQPITNAEEIIQIGPLVLGKNPKYGSIDDFDYADGGKVVSKLANAFKKASNAADALMAEKRVFKTSDGYTFRETPTGEITNGDMSWPNAKEFMKDMPHAYQAGDDLGKRKAMIEGYGRPDPENLVNDISKFMPDDAQAQFQRALNKQNAPVSKPNLTVVKAKGGRVEESPADMARFNKRFAMHKAIGGSVKKPQKFDGGGIASPEESSGSPPDREQTKAGLMAEYLAKAAKDQGKEELSSLKKPRAVTDLLNRGVLANNPVSAVIDMVNMGLVPLDVLGSKLTGRDIKVSSDKPFLGSEHLKDLMNEYNITSGEERPMMETALSFASPVGMIKGAQKTADLAKKAPEALNTVRGGLETMSADVQRPFRSATLTMEGVAPDLGQKGGDKFKDLVTKRMISGEGAPVSMDRMGGRKTEQTMGQGLYENFAKQLETNPMVGVTIPRAGNLSTNKRLIADIGTAGRELGQEMVAAHKFTPLLFKNPKDATAMMIGGSEPLTKDQIRDIYKLLPGMIVTHSPKNNSMFIAPFEGDSLDYKKAAQAASEILGKGAKVQFGKADSTKDIMFRGDYDKMEARPPSAESTEMRNRLKKAEERIVRGPSVSQSGRQSQPSTLTSTVR